MTLRGSLILCDRLWSTPEGQWIIGGTFSFRWTTGPVVMFDHGQWALYLRLESETAGVYPIKVSLRDLVASPQLPPVMEATLQLAIADPNLPAEAGIQLPALTFPAPGVPTPGHPLRYLFRFTATLHDEPIASANLEMRYHHHHDHHPPRLPPGHGSEG